MKKVLDWFARKYGEFVIAGLWAAILGWALTPCIVYNLKHVKNEHDMVWVMIEIGLVAIAHFLVMKLGFAVVARRYRLKYDTNDSL